jgi:hypothetical protein
MAKKQPKLFTLSGKEPHPDWKGWEGFIKTCEIRGEARGVIFYGRTNCNYIVFPDGMVHQNFAFHGENMMQDIRKRGRKKVQAELRQRYADIQAMLKESRESTDEIVRQLTTKK